MYSFARRAIRSRGLSVRHDTSISRGKDTILAKATQLSNLHTSQSILRVMFQECSRKVPDGWVPSEDGRDPYNTSTRKQGFLTFSGPWSSLNSFHKTMLGNPEEISKIFGSGHSSYRDYPNNWGNPNNWGTGFSSYGKATWGIDCLDFRQSMVVGTKAAAHCTSFEKWLIFSLINLICSFFLSVFLDQMIFSESKHSLLHEEMIGWLLIDSHWEDYVHAETFKYTAFDITSPTAGSSVGTPRYHVSSCVLVLCIH